MVLCHRCPTKLLVKCPLWPKLGLLMEWQRPNMASRPLDCRLLHWCLGRISADHWDIIQETLLAFACVCDRARSTEMVSDVVGYHVRRIKSSVGGYRRGNRSSQDRIVGWEVTLVVARCSGCYPRCRFRNDAITGISSMPLVLTCRL